MKASGLRVNFEVAMALDLGNASVPSVVRKASRQRSLRRSVLRLEKPEDTENPFRLRESRSFGRRGNPLNDM